MSYVGQLDRAGTGQGHYPDYPPSHPPSHPPSRALDLPWTCPGSVDRSGKATALERRVGRASLPPTATGPFWRNLLCPSSPKRQRFCLAILTREAEVQPLQ